MQNSSTGTSTLSRSAAKSLSSQREAPRNTRRQSNSQDHQDPWPDCSCLGRAVAVIEEIEVQKQQASTINADVILSLQGRALDQCDALLECQHCANVSHSVMLLILLCEKLVTHPLLPGNGIENHDLQSGASQQSLEAGTDSNKYLHGPRILFGKYEVSSLYERTQVVHALQSCFTQRLIKLLGRFEGLAALKGWQTQLMMVVNLKNRILSSE